MKENIEEAVERLEKSINDVWFSTTYSQEDEERDLQLLLSDYKRVLKENEELKKKYNSLTDKIILKIDEYDYKFEKAKKQSKNDIADYYWDLIINFKKLLGGK